MAKTGRDLVSEAVKDASRLKDAALASAKNQIIEGMTPALRRLVESALDDSVDRLARGMEFGSGGGKKSMDGRGDNYPGESHTGFEEGKDKGADTMPGHESKSELDMEALTGFFPSVSEMEEPEGGMKIDDAAIPGLDDMGGHTSSKMEGHMSQKDERHSSGHASQVGEAKHKSEEGAMDEQVEINEAELMKVYNEALQLEVQVKKGFGEPTKIGELDELDPNAGIADVKKGEAHWNDKAAEPPAKKDWTVKEAIQRGIAENRALRTKLGEAARLIKALGVKLHEVNLFNSKVLHVNRILNTHRLTTEQKSVVLESIDKAKSLPEVARIYETLSSSMKVNEKLMEGRNPRKPAANAQRARTSGTVDPRVLSESVDRGTTGGSDGTYDRFKVLAGLTK